MTTLTPALPDRAELRDVLDETTRMLSYLWEAENDSGSAVMEMFSLNDPLTEDVPKAIQKARAALLDAADAREREVTALREASASAGDLTGSLLGLLAALREALSELLDTDEANTYRWRSSRKCRICEQARRRARTLVGHVTEEAES